MSKQVEDSLPKESNMKKVILIQNGFTKIIPEPSTQPLSAPLPIPPNFHQNLKQNLNINPGNQQPAPFSSFKPTSTIPPPPLSYLKMMRNQFVPDNVGGAATSFNIDMIVTTLLNLSQEIKMLGERIGVLEERMVEEERGKMVGGKEKEREREREKEKEESDVSSLKKKRRKAEDIVKSYYCEHSNCGKGYGSEMSLNLHVKLKHVKMDGDKEKEKEQSEQRVIANQDQNLIENNFNEVNLNSKTISISTQPENQITMNKDIQQESVKL